MVPSGGAGGQAAEPAVEATAGDRAQPASAVATPVLDICPHLVDASGPWRRAQPSRTHRCGARSPAPTIPALTQKRICLAAEHRSCEFYLAAMHARDEALLADHVRPERLEMSRFHVGTRPMPLATDGVQGGAPLPRTAPARPRRPLALALAVVGVGALALVAVVASMPGRPSGITAVSTTPGAATDTAGRTGAPGPSGAPTPAPSAITSPLPTPSPLPTVSATPRPTPDEPVLRRYRVRRGDTLNRIAARFDTTVRAIRKANDLAQDEDIRIGQVLRIP